MHPLSLTGSNLIELGVDYKYWQEEYVEYVEHVEDEAEGFVQQVSEDDVFQEHGEHHRDVGVGKHPEYGELSVLVVPVKR